MVLIAAFGTIAFSHGLFAELRWLHFLHLSGIVAIDLLAMGLVARRTVTVVRRYGFGGPARPRWWFELGRATWILVIVCFVLAIAGTMTMGRRPGPIVVATQDTLFLFSKYGLPAFLAMSSLGYVLSFARGLPRRGKAFECVQFFFGMFVASLLFGAAGLAFLRIARPDPNQMAIGALVLAAIAAIAAVMISLIQRGGTWKSQANVRSD